MKILVIHSNTIIIAWLCNEPIEIAPLMITNGYPEFQSQWDAGELTAVVAEVPEENAFKSDLYTIREGLVVLRE